MFLREVSFVLSGLAWSEFGGRKKKKKENQQLSVLVHELFRQFHIDRIFKQLIKKYTIQGCISITATSVHLPLILLWNK